MPAPAPAVLSRKQATVADFVRRGLSNKLIAREMDISEETVKKHVREILRKYAVKNRTQIAMRRIAETGLESGL